MWKLKYWFRRKLRQIDDWLPWFCDCGHVCQKQHVMWEHTTWGKRVSFCPRCHKERFS